MIRNAADTEVPIMPPILLKAPNLSLIAEDVAATTIEVTITILYQRMNCQNLESGKISPSSRDEKYGRLWRT